MEIRRKALLLVSHDKDVLGQFEEVHDLLEIKQGKLLAKPCRGGLSMEPSCRSSSAKSAAAFPVDCDYSIFHCIGQWLVNERVGC